MNKVRGMFVVESVTENRHSPGTKMVTMSPVSNDGIPEHEAFHKWTPSGCIEMQINNPVAAEQFNPGDEFYVDFVKKVPQAAEPEAEIETAPAAPVSEVPAPPEAPGNVPR